MPYDIVHPAAKERAQEHGIEPLVLGEDVALVKNTNERKDAAALIILATRPDRDLLEDDIDGATEIETSTKQDYLHHRAAGLDQVKAQILAKDEKALVLSLDALRRADNPAVVLGRMQQNARIAKKKGAPVLLASLAKKPEDVPTPHDHEAFWRAMGVPQDLVETHQERFEKWVERARVRASSDYVAEGVRKA